MLQPLDALVEVVDEAFQRVETGLVIRGWGLRHRGSI
jgi:hypothetical protein